MPRCPRCLLPCLAAAGPACPYGCACRGLTVRTGGAGGGQVGAWMAADRRLVSLQHQDGAHVGQRRHLQDGLLPAQRRPPAVLRVRPAAGAGGPGHPGTGLRLRPPPPEASPPRGTPRQRQGPLRWRWDTDAWPPPWALAQAPVVPAWPRGCPGHRDLDQLCGSRVGCQGPGGQHSCSTPRTSVSGHETPGLG